MSPSTIPTLLAAAELTVWLYRASQPWCRRWPRSLRLLLLAEALPWASWLLAPGGSRAPALRLLTWGFVIALAAEGRVHLAERARHARQHPDSSTRSETPPRPRPPSASTPRRHAG